MIVCPHCNHQNPDAAVQCEACYTPLPAMTTCPHCGASVQADASFCGQCGFNLQVAASAVEPLPATVSPDFEIPDLPSPEPLVKPEPLLAGAVGSPQGGVSEPENLPELPTSRTSNGSTGESEAAPPAASTPPKVPPSSSQTQLQTQTVRLLHVQTNSVIEIPGNLTVIHIGKPNDRIPPDVDVSGFPHSEIVSRIHADIRVEGDIYYIEDVGSSNGTYVNNAPLPSGNRHRLRPGDRIALGKGDKVTFLFQVS
jgi:pSer/pThr/pTyr-binding forkhead associated (FHA) protein/ribosomal protein L40E